MQLDRCIIGDCRDVLPTLEAGSVQCVVTSPPYYGLRDYGVSGQIGLEQTPQAYVDQMIAVFREVRRVLRDDGTVWLNLGDSYASNQSNNGGYSAKSTLAGFSNPNTKGRQANDGTTPRKIYHSLKPKDLVGIPWRVAFALQADDWYLRQDIIWAKPNPMPESVTDRCTKSHEYLFLLAKSERYYYDAAAIAEPYLHEYRVGPPSHGKEYSVASGRNDGGQHRTGAEMGDATGTRNKRSVWTVATHPYSEAHFATFPPALIEPCILAGSRPGDVVLDPFFGSGTVGEVAQNLGRRWIGVELNPEYAKLQDKRTAQMGMVLE